MFRVAQFAGMHLHKRIIGNEHYSNRFKFRLTLILLISENKDFHQAIQSGFLKLDEELKLVSQSTF